MSPPPSPTVVDNPGFTGLTQTSAASLGTQSSAASAGSSGLPVDRRDTDSAAAASARRRMFKVRWFDFFSWLVLLFHRVPNGIGHHGYPSIG